SSLSLALAQAGLDYLSDDRTLVREDRGKLTAWGLLRAMKQRADAIRYFPQLREKEGRENWNADPVFRFDPAQVFGITQASSGEPQWILFLERHTDPFFQLEEILPEEAVSLLQPGLHQEVPEAADRQRLTIEALCQKPCFRLRYGGNPHAIAGTLRQLSVSGTVRPTLTRS